MSRRATFAALTSLLLAAPHPARAQLNFSNLLEARVGKDPDDFSFDFPDNRLTFFDQFNLDYYDGNLNLGLRFETFRASEGGDLDYTEFVHRYASWNSEWVDARVGNYQAMFGRGLVLRAFELTGIVREEEARLFGDSRDLDGVKVRLHRGPVEITALAGKPRFANDLPDFDRSTRELVSGAEAAAEVFPGVRAGGEYVRLDAPELFTDEVKTSEVGGGFAQLAWGRWLRRVGLERLSLDTYVEVARASGLTLSPLESSSKIEPDRGRGFYIAQTASVRDAGLRGLRVGASWEYKDYQNFLLGGGVNEPPPLVREHTFVLLNRNTHVLQPMQEEGYQFEPRLDYKRRASLVLNWSRAENRFLPERQDRSGNVLDPMRPARFEEFYAQLTGRAHGASLTLFTGDSQDGAELLFDRRTYGVYTVVPIRGEHSLELEYEQMTGLEVRRVDDDLPFKDNYASLQYAWAGRFSLTVVRESTDQVGEAGPPDPVTGGVARRFFDSLSGSVRLGNHHELFAFWGRRRGGLQCTAGTCYIVPPFDGVLTQVVSRF